MFGNKNKASNASESAVDATKKGKPAKEPKPPKEPKAAKKKAVPKSLRGKGSPNFIAAHIEKIALAGTMLAVGYFIYAGLSAESYPTSNNPDKMQSEATSLLNQIKEDHWEQIAEERQVKHDFATLASEARRPTDPKRYAQSDVVWDPKPARVFERRGDPALLPPQDLLAKNVFGALAVEVPVDAADPFDTLEDAEPLKKRAPPSRNRGRGRGGSGYGEEGMEMESDGGSGYPGGNASAAASGRRLTASYDLGVKSGSGSGSADMMGGDMMGGGMMGGGMMGGGMMGGGMMGGGTGAGATVGGLSENRNKAPKTKIGSRGVFFNAITALVPHKEMAEEFDKQFTNTGPTDPRRDLPVYKSFEVQRVDVTADPTRKVDDNEWKTITDAINQMNLISNQKWAVKPPLGFPVPEVIDQNAYAVALTMPIPPMLVRDYREFSKHPHIDWSWDAKPLIAPRKQKSKKEEEDQSDLLPGERKRGPAGMGLGGGYGGMMGGGMMGGGYGSEMGGEEGYGGDMMGGGYGSEMGGDEGYGSDMMGGGYGSDMMGGGMMGGGMMGGYGMSGAKLPQPEFKMVRCYDMLPMNRSEIGKIYRYRIRLIMQDPNYPDDSTLQSPAPNELKDEVWARVSAIQKKDDAAIKANPKTKRTMRYTDWSEPSPPVMVRAPYEVFAGSVEFDGPRKFAVGDKNVAVSTTEPEGAVIIAGMDKKLNTGAMYAFEEDVRRGTVLARKADAEVISPTTKKIKIDKNYELNSQATVVDMRGGREMAGSGRDDPLYVAGEFMILHSDGRVQVTHELDDMFLYRLYSFADEKEAAAKSSAAPTGMGEGGYGMEGG